MAKFRDILTKHNIQEALKSQIFREGKMNSEINVGGIKITNVHMPLDEYAKQIGAIPYQNSQINNF